MFPSYFSPFLLFFTFFPDLHFINSLPGSGGLCRGLQGQLHDEKGRRLLNPDHTPKIGDKFELVMPLLEGQMAATYFGAHPSSSAVDGPRTFMQTIAAIFRFQEQGFVHKDLTLGNLWMEPDGRLRLADFGTSKKIADYEGMQEIAGTPFYIAPETFSSLSVSTSKVDVFSLGVSGLHMMGLGSAWKTLGPFNRDGMTLSGKPVQTDLLRRHLLERDCPPPVADLMIRCLDVDPEKRPDMNEVMMIIDRDDFLKSSFRSANMAQDPELVGAVVKGNTPKVEASPTSSGVGRSLLAAGAGLSEKDIRDMMGDFWTS